MKRWVQEINSPTINYSTTSLWGRSNPTGVCLPTRSILSPSWRTNDTGSIDDRSNMGLFWKLTDVLAGTDVLVCFRLRSTRRCTPWIHTKADFLYARYRFLPRQIHPHMSVGFHMRLIHPNRLNICIVYVYGLYWSYMHTDNKYMPRWKSQSGFTHSRVLGDESIH